MWKPLEREQAYRCNSKTLVCMHNSVKKAYKIIKSGWDILRSGKTYKDNIRCGQSFRWSLRESYFEEFMLISAFILAIISCIFLNSDSFSSNIRFIFSLSVAVSPAWWSKISSACPARASSANFWRR